jgi:hypothetical protein
MRGCLSDLGPAAVPGFNFFFRVLYDFLGELCGKKLFVPLNQALPASCCPNLNVTFGAKNSPKDLPLSRLLSKNRVYPAVQ